MDQEKMNRLRALTDLLNQYRREYYDLNAASVDDAEYDRLFDELAQLEQELGAQMGNSPTQTVGWPAKEGLAKVSHHIPLLSLDKTKQVDELCNFIGDQPVMLMLKLDGLTIKVTYEYGMIVEAATRGDGDVGENVTHNVRGISGIPSQIPYKGRLVVTGEAFIRPSDFEALPETAWPDSRRRRHIPRSCWRKSRSLVKRRWNGWINGLFNAISLRGAALTCWRCATCFISCKRRHYDGLHNCSDTARRPADAGPDRCPVGTGGHPSRYAPRLYLCNV